MLDISHTILEGLVMRDIEKWCRKHDKRELRLFLPPSDRLRLLRLRTWAMRYKLTVAEIMDLLVPPLRKGITQEKGRGLGIRVSTLTSDKAEEILQDRLFRLYPDGANISAWRERERDAQRSAEELEETEGFAIRRRHLRLLDAASVHEFRAAYTRAVEKGRLETDAETWRKRKNYRDNPWL